MTIVVDASVAVKWVCAEPDSDAAVALRSDALIAPALWLAEAGNALWRRVRIGDIGASEANARLSRLRDAPVTTLAMEPLLDHALSLATDIGHPIYDCVYLALAIERDTYVITADRHFCVAADRPELAGRVRPLVP